jgi:hypothetical protein
MAIPASVVQYFHADLQTSAPATRIDDNSGDANHGAQRGTITHSGGEFLLTTTGTGIDTSLSTPTGSYTYFWRIKWTTNNASTSPVLVSSNNNSVTVPGFYFDSALSTFRLFQASTGVNFGYNPFTAWDEDTWHDVCMVFTAGSPGTATLYVDDMATAAGSGNIANPSGTVRLIRWYLYNTVQSWNNPVKACAYAPAALSQTDREDLQAQVLSDAGGDPAIEGSLAESFSITGADAVAGQVATHGSLAESFSLTGSDSIAGQVAAHGSISDSMSVGFTDAIVGQVPVFGSLAESFGLSFADSISGTVEDDSPIEGALAESFELDFSDSITGQVATHGAISEAFNLSFSDAIAAQVAVHGALAEAFSVSFVDAISSGPGATPEGRPSITSFEPLTPSPSVVSFDPLPSPTVVSFEPL